jgi:hypothetical protein
VKVQGHLNLEVERRYSKHGGWGDHCSSFDLDVISLDLTYPINEQMAAELNVSLRHGASDSEGRGGIDMDFGFLRYQVLEGLDAKFGKFQTPFGFFNDIYNHKTKFLAIKEPASTNRTKRIAANAMLFFPRSGVGVGLSGQYSSIDFDIQLTNGEQDADHNAHSANPYEDDNNLSKALTGRIRWQEESWLNTGISFYQEKNQTNNMDERQGKTAYGIYASASLGNIGLLTEYDIGHFTTKKQNLNSSWEQRGWFVQLDYKIQSRFNPFLRHEEIDPDMDEDRDIGKDFIVGMKFDIDKNLQIKFEHHSFSGQDNTYSVTHADHIQAGEPKVQEDFGGKGWSEARLALVAGW